MPVIEAPLQISARVIAGCGMPLKIDNIRRRAILVAAEKMVVCHLVEGRARRISRNVTAEPVVFAIGVYDHRHGVPPDETLDASLDLPVAGIGRLLLHR